MLREPYVGHDSDLFSPLPSPPIVTLNPPSPPIIIYVTECHNFHALLTFFISSLEPLLHLQAYIDQNSKIFDDKYVMVKFEKFWSWTILPLTSGALMMRFVIKPRRRDWGYRGFLMGQLGVYTVSRVLHKHSGLFEAPVLVVKVGLFGATFFLAERVRNRLASLPDEELHRFLTKVVLKDGMLVGLA